MIWDNYGWSLTLKTGSDESIILTVYYTCVTVQSMQNLYVMNISISEYFLDGPVGVHYREVLLYL